MATPLSASALLAALRAEGVHVKEFRSWRSHNRNHKGPWGGVNGVVIHHTAGVGSGLADFCYDGTAALPGPVCHAFLSKKATVYLVGHGRANHAGTFAQNAHNAVVNEASAHPRPDAAEPIDGNTRYYGIEIENRGDGKDPYPKEQYEQAVRWAAAICRAHAWSADSVIGHKEGTRRKIDPTFSMATFRRDVAERLKHPASWGGTGGTNDEEDEGMPKYVSLGRSWASVQPGDWDAIEWDQEWEDEPGGHGAGGSQFVLGPARYTGEVAIRVDGLPLGGQAQVRLSEVEVDGEYVQDHPIAEILASDGDAFAKIPITGRVRDGRGVRVRIKHWGTAPVRVTGTVKTLVWKER